MGRHSRSGQLGAEGTRLFALDSTGSSYGISLVWLGVTSPPNPLRKQSVMDGIEYFVLNTSLRTVRVSFDLVPWASRR